MNKGVLKTYLRDNKEKNLQQVDEILTRKKDNIRKDIEATLYDYRHELTAGVVNLLVNNSLLSTLNKSQFSKNTRRSVTETRRMVAEACGMELFGHYGGFDLKGVPGNEDNEKDLENLDIWVTKTREIINNGYDELLRKMAFQSAGEELADALIKLEKGIKEALKAVNQ